MCAPVTVTTGGAVNGCVGICRVIPQITGLAALIGVLLWNFKGLFKRKNLGLTKKKNRIVKDSG